MQTTKQNLKLGDFVVGETVNVIIDRPLGSSHPKYPQNIYPINYGYYEGVVAPDGDYQDVYLLGVDEPVNEYVATIIAIIIRDNDTEEKWVAAPKGKTFSREEIADKVDFMERFHKSHICLTKEEYETAKKGNK